MFKKMITILMVLTALMTYSNLNAEELSSGYVYVEGVGYVPAGSTDTTSGDGTNTIPDDLGPEETDPTDPDPNTGATT